MNKSAYHDPRQTEIFVVKVSEGKEPQLASSEAASRLLTDAEALRFGGIAVSRQVRAEGLLEAIKAESQSRKAEGFIASAPEGAYNSPEIVERYGGDLEKIDHMVLGAQDTYRDKEVEARKHFARATGYLALIDYFKGGQSEDSKRTLAQVEAQLESEFKRFKGTFYFSPQAKSARPAFTRRLKKQVETLSR